MKYFINHKQSNETLLLFHGTGGNQDDLLPIAHYIDSKANTVGFLGNETEGGYRRFFNRFSIGKFDIPNLIKNTNELNDDIKKLANDPFLSKSMFIGLGFSNGANILQSLIQLHPESLKKVILLSPVYVRKDVSFPNLKGTDILIVTSLNDPYSTKEETLALIEDLNKAYANVEVFLHDHGHKVTEESLNFAKAWYLKLK